MFSLLRQEMVNELRDENFHLRNELYDFVCALLAESCDVLLVVCVCVWASKTK